MQATARKTSMKPFRVIKPREPFEQYGDLLNVSDICEITGMSAQTVRRCVERGEIPGCKIGRRWFVPKSRFIEFVEGGNAHR